MAAFFKKIIGLKLQRKTLGDVTFPRLLHLFYADLKLFDFFCIKNNFTKYFAKCCYLFT